MQAQSALAKPGSKAKAKAGGGFSPAELLAQLKRTEAELKSLQLRYEARDVPYYRVIGEFFNKKLGNFVDPEHECHCNLCGTDIEAAKQKAVEKAIAKYEAASREARASGTEGAVDPNG